MGGPKNMWLLVRTVDSMDIMDIMALLQLQHQLEIVAPHGASGCQFQHSNTQQTATAAAQLLEELIALLGQLALHFAAGFPQHPGNMLQTANSQSDIQLQPLTSVPLGVSGFQFQPNSTLLLARAAMVMQLWLGSKHCQSQNKSQRQLDWSMLKASHFEEAPLSSRKWAQSSV